MSWEYGIRLYRAEEWHKLLNTLMRLATGDGFYRDNLLDIE